MPDSTKILKAKEVITMTGLSRVTIWRMERKGDFPRRIQITEHRVGWFEHEIIEWLESRPRV